MTRALIALVLWPALFGCVTAPKSERRPAAEVRTVMVGRDFPFGRIDLRVGIFEPIGDPVGDILYIPGFADRWDNHDPLFTEWRRAGLRVIAMDLPSHGENSGAGNDLSRFFFEEIAQTVVAVEAETKSNRPLILAGWSTGGLLVVRMMQTGWGDRLSRSPSGLVLFAPGVSVHTFPWTFGDGWGSVSVESLTHDPRPPHVAGHDPTTPFWNRLAFTFSPRMILNSKLSRWQHFPKKVPTLFFVGGDQEDRYAKSAPLREWVRQKNDDRRLEGYDPIVGVQCPRARHELDNELPEFGGPEVRKVSADFAAAFAKGLPAQAWPAFNDAAVCRPF